MAKKVVKDKLMSILDNLSEDKIVQLLEAISEKETKEKKGKGENKNQIKFNRHKPEDNLFLKFKPSSSEKSVLDKDKKIDKILGKNWEYTERREAIEMIEIQCMVCNRLNKISPKLLPPETSRYTCDRCIARGKNK